MLNENILNKIGINKKWLLPLNNAFQKHNITDIKEAAMFLAQTTKQHMKAMIIKDLKRASDTLLKDFLMYSKKE